MARAFPFGQLPTDVQKRLSSQKRSASARMAWQRRKKKAHHAARRDELPGFFRALCKQSGLPMPVIEHRFHETRRWRWDYAWPEEKIALEVDGGIFTRGAHVRGARILLTHDKLNAAAILGWRLLYRVPRNLCTPETIELLRQILSRDYPLTASSEHGIFRLST